MASRTTGNGATTLYTMVLMLAIAAVAAAAVAAERIVSRK